MQQTQVRVLHVACQKFFVLPDFSGKWRCTLPEFSSPFTVKTAPAKKNVHLPFALQYATVYLPELSSKLKAVMFNIYI